ncbi:efflux transporter outer membrane subunit [uncultured Sphingomonas sp.]|uniref:efflux transporter outer membrane subunit n=1 Tax=uncultured Sphingomonas sp. TaxID=158754 RepID=UPI0035CB2B5B
MARTLPLAAALLLAGCNFAPDYDRPTGEVPPALPQGGVYPPAVTDAPDVTAIGWRDFFTDPRLREVIAAGLENNRDLRLAAANVLQARARYRIQRADLVPTTGLSASATYTNNPVSATGATAGPGAATGGTTGTGTGVGTDAGNLQYYSLTAGFSNFELDLFGRVRNLTRAAQERYFASEEAQRSTRISLIAEIATAWLQLAADQDQLQLSRSTLQTFGQTRTLTEAQFRIGVASELEARQADTNYQAALNDIAVLETRVAQDRNALDLLVGAPVATPQLPTGLGEGQATLAQLPPGLSSAVLLRRPDVLDAEHQLIAEHADIGAARAARFPTISLTATVGTISAALSGLFAGGSFTYTGAPAATLPIFDGGRISGNIRLAEADRQAALATYERTVQVAFREVADALAQRGTIDRQIDAQTIRARSAEIAARLADARYRSGVDSFLTALDAQRTAYAADQQLVTTRQARAANLVELYRSLGGGLR